MNPINRVRIPFRLLSFFGALSISLPSHAISPTEERLRVDTCLQLLSGRDFGHADLTTALFSPAPDAGPWTSEDGQQAAEVILRQAQNEVASTHDWNAFFGRLPIRTRGPVLRKLLAETREPIALMAALEPLPGVRDVILEKLRGMNLNNAQALTLIPTAARFAQFFPETPVRYPVGQDGKDLGVLLGAALDLSDNSGWTKSRTLMYATDTNSKRLVTRLLGYTPVRSIKELAAALNRQLQPDADAGDSVVSQTRGLIVQGYHEQSGRSLFWSQTSRGVGQVEEDAPNLMSALKYALSYSSVRSQTSPLEQRLLMRYWGVARTDGNIIEEIRQLALKATKADRQFYSLRVEIHNYPTRSVLRRTKEYRAAYALKKSGAPDKFLMIVDKLIADIELFHGTGAKPITLPADIHSRFAKTDYVRFDNGKIDTQIRAFAGGGAPFEQLNRLTKIRELLAVNYARSIDRLKETASTPNVTSGWFRQVRQSVQWSDYYQRFRSLATEYFPLDEALGDLSLQLTSQMVNEFENQRPTVSGTTDFFGSLVQALGAEGYYTAGYASEIAQAAAKIESGSLNERQKISLLLDLYASVLDFSLATLNENFGRQDLLTRRVLAAPGAEGFTDSLMKSSLFLVMGHAIDGLKRKTDDPVDVFLNGQPFATENIEIFNPGHASGVLRVDPNPLELKGDEIAVFSSMPAEVSAMGGMMTVGSGARLSHLQLLAKSVGLPNVKISTKLFLELQKLNGKQIDLVVSGNHRLAIREGLENVRDSQSAIAVPTPDYSVQTPVSFRQMEPLGYKNIAGPKGVILARIFNHPRLREHAKDGVIIPLGFFKKYAGRVGLSPWIRSLTSTRVENQHLVAVTARQISKIIAENPLPPDLIAEVMTELQALQARTGHDSGYFLRSDTPAEDLEGFNGAGLNESVPNVLLDPRKVDEALRRVWQSPYTERAISWRAKAFASAFVIDAEPSVVVMPTVNAASSGVMLTRGGPQWTIGDGSISANWGIGSVVQSTTAVEEVRFVNGQPYHIGFSSANLQPVEDKARGGLKNQTIERGKRILTPEQMTLLNTLGAVVDREIFNGQLPHGADIEWAIDMDGNLILLQARPNI